MSFTFPGGGTAFLSERAPSAGGNDVGKSESEFKFIFTARLERVPPRGLQSGDKGGASGMEVFESLGLTPSRKSAVG